MTNVNMLLFAAVNASANPSTGTVAAAIFLADGLIWLVPLGLTAAWLWGDAVIKRSALAAALSGGLALLVAQLIGLFYYHPRPFAIHVGHTLIPHVADGSFPSDHGTLMAAVGVSLLVRRESRLLGAVLLAAWLPMAWARIYLGVHFPADLLGGLVIGTMAAECVRRLEGPLVQPAFSFTARVYARVFALCIRWGWVRA